MKFKKLLFVAFILVMILLPNKVFAATTIDNVDDEMKKLSPDLENITFYMKEPTTYEESEFMIAGYVGSILDGDYYVQGMYYGGEDKICEVTLQSPDFEAGEFLYYDSELNKPVFSDPVSGWQKVYTLKSTFVEPTEQETVNGYVSSLNDFSMFDPDTYYILEDLSLINYYMTSSKSELWNPGAPGRAIKYSSLNELTKGANVNFYLEVRAGNQDESLMFESAFGPMSVIYNGYLYGGREEGLYLKRVIYIPENTDNDPTEYAKVAQKRINDYLGDDLVTVADGGLLSSLPDDSEDDLYPITSDDGHYYNVTIGERTYKFYILKGTTDKLKEPVYAGMDIESKIEITSSDSSIPLDTALTVTDVTNSSTAEIIGTSNYKSYNITLFSSAKNADIENLENGKFRVKIPVPEELNGKELVVYYISTNNEIEEHTVTPEDNYAVFETNHFSTYTLAEKVAVNNTNNNQNTTNTNTNTTTTNTNTTSTETTTKTDTTTVSNPKTYDGVLIYISMFIFSIIGLVLTKVYKNKID